MSTTAYMGVLFLCAALYSLSVTLADKSHGPMGLALASCVGILLLSSIGYLDWRSQPREETVLSTYLIASVLGSIAASSVIGLLRKKPLAVRVVLGIVTWLCVGFVVVLRTAFF